MINNKSRIIKEITNLLSEQNNYKIYYNDENIYKIFAYIKAPVDSLYRHCFIKVEITLNDDYPKTPPECKFINYNNSRIHPNLYQNGKICLSILGTWSGPSWTSNMSIETILISIQSLLDNTPYIHEPGQKDNSEYNKYVRYKTFETCLIDYYEKENVKELKEYIENYIKNNYDDIISDLQVLKEYQGYKINTHCYNVKSIILDYERIIIKIKQMYDNINGKNTNFDKNLYCNICKNNINKLDGEDVFELECNHFFHYKCILDINKCPVCDKKIDCYMLDYIKKEFKKINYFNNLEKCGFCNKTVNSQITYKLTCNHEFHIKCLSIFTKKDICPNCRKEITKKI